MLCCASLARGQGTQAQTIHFLPISDRPVNTAPFQVVALSSSYLPVTLSIQGPATLTGRVVELTGVGTITVTASQAGNSVYAPAQAQLSFQATPVTASVQAQPLALVYGQAFSSAALQATATAPPIPDYAADTTNVTSQLLVSALNPGGALSYPASSSVFSFEGTKVGTYRDPRAVGAVGSIGQPAPYAINYKVDFTCNCQQFEIALVATGGLYRLEVDGAYTSPDATQEIDVDPLVNYILVRFPDKRSREIKMTAINDPGFYGINVANGDTLSPFQTAVGSPVMIFGDSWTGPTIRPPALPPAQAGLNGSGYPQTLGEFFNWDYWDDGVGGSGFNEVGLDQLGRTYVQRIETDVCPYKFSAVLIEGGGNDGSPEPETQAAVTKVLDELHACLPGVPVYIYGPEGPEPVPAQAIANAVATAAGPIYYQDFGALGWFYGLPTDPTTGNDYLYFNGHPTPLGHDYLAEQIANDLVTHFPAMMPQPHPVFAPVAVDGTLTASAADGTLLPAGSDSVSVTFNPSDTMNYAVANTSVAVTVAKANSSTALTAAQADGKVTLTAMVAPQYAGSPGGTVSFLNAGAIVASAAVATGVAVFQEPLGMLPATGLSLTASYSGDSNFNPSQTAAAVTALAQGPDFSFTPQMQLTVAPGGSAALPLSITPLGGITGSLTATCQGLPSGATCALANSPVSLGANPLTASLTITVPGQTAAAKPLHRQPAVPAPLETSAAIVLGVSALRRRRRGVALMLCAGALLTAGCGASSTQPAPSPQSYTVQVTLSTGSGAQTIAHTQPFTLVVS